MPAISACALHAPRKQSPARAPALNPFSATQLAPARLHTPWTSPAPAAPPKAPHDPPAHPVDEALHPLRPLCQRGVLRRAAHRRRRARERKGQRRRRLRAVKVLLVLVLVLVLERGAGAAAAAAVGGVRRVTAAA